MPSSNIFKLLVVGTAIFSASTWSSGAVAQSDSRQCYVDQVAVFSNRIHLKCNPDKQKAYTSDILYYAMAISEDAKLIDNVIALAIGAKQTNKPLVIWFAPNDYRSVPGCQGNNCRRLSAVALE